MADNNIFPSHCGRCTGGIYYLDPLPILQKNPDFLEFCKGIRVHTGVRIEGGNIDVDGMWIQHAYPSPVTNLSFVLKAFVTHHLNPHVNAYQMTPSTEFAVELWVRGGSHMSGETENYYHCLTNNAYLVHFTIVTLNNKPIWCLGMVWIPFAFPSPSKIRDWNYWVSRPHIPFPVDAMQVTLRRVPDSENKPVPRANVVKLEDHPRW